MPALFAGLIVEQCLDLHSTLTAAANQHEGNKAVNWIASHLGFAPTIVLAKLFMLAVIGFLIRTWRQSKGSHEREFMVSLGLVFVTYAVVICNNYVARLG
ncbi:hypothetical protein DBR42_00880 [Pelomonas sp. HMWF004]|nr:hypothetical protein DBR42_00880 [Pelomonas sp. HMWF004]